jgi:hypothetical protein
MLVREKDVRADVQRRGKYSGDEIAKMIAYLSRYDVRGNSVPAATEPFHRDGFFDSVGRVMEEWLRNKHVLPYSVSALVNLCIAVNLTSNIFTMNQFARLFEWRDDIVHFALTGGQVDDDEDEDSPSSSSPPPNYAELHPRLWESRFNANVPSSSRRREHEHEMSSEEAWKWLLSKENAYAASEPSVDWPRDY